MVIVRANAPSRSSYTSEYSTPTSFVVVVVLFGATAADDDASVVSLLQWPLSPAAAIASIGSARGIRSCTFDGVTRISTSSSGGSGINRPLCWARDAVGRQLRGHHRCLVFLMLAIFWLLH